MFAPMPAFVLRSASLARLVFRNMWLARCGSRSRGGRIAGGGREGRAGRTRRRDAHSAPASRIEIFGRRGRWRCGASAVPVRSRRLVLQRQRLMSVTGSPAHIRLQNLDLVYWYSCWWPSCMHLRSSRLAGSPPQTKRLGKQRVVFGDGGVWRASPLQPHSFGQQLSPRSARRGRRTTTTV